MPLNLYKRKATGIWYIRGNVQDEHFDQSTRTNSRSEAEQIRAKLEADIFKEQVYGARAVATFAEAVVAYMEAGGDDTHMTPLLDAFGTKTLSEVNQAALDKLTKGRKAKPATLVRQSTRRVAAVLNFAASDAGGKLCDPVRFRKPKVKNARTDYLTPEEAEAWLAALPRAPEADCRLLPGYGVRASEAVSLTNGRTSRQRPSASCCTRPRATTARSFYLQKRARALCPSGPKPGRRSFLNSRASRGTATTPST
jgi:integrase